MLLHGVTNQALEPFSDDRAGDDRRAAIAVVLIALALFAPTVVQFEPEATDLSAIRILSGAVLYRNIWTMYAPGSIYAIALAYSIFGVHMIVGERAGSSGECAGRRSSVPIRPPGARGRSTDVLF